jgi:protein involved in polysaccharide export with SLBB domain
VNLVMKMSRYFIFCIFALVLATGSLSSRAAEVEQPVTREEASPNILPAVADKHIIVPGDVVELKVYQEDELNSRVRVDTDGTVNLPLLGNVKISGKSIPQAMAVIRELLEKDYLVNPQVAVSVIDFAKRRFAVLGQVAKPGYYEIPSNEAVNLLQAIATAGGYTRIADAKNVTVKRVVDGKETVIKLNAKAMANEKNSKNFEIQADDTITVAESIL